MAQQVLYILFSFEFPVMKQMRYFADGFTSLCSKVIGLIKIDIRNQLIDTHLLEGCLMEFERCYLHYISMKSMLKSLKIGFMPPIKRSGTNWSE